MRNLITFQEWDELEELLAKCQIPYKVSFDNHSGLIRKIISIEQISVMEVKNDG